MLKHSGWLKRQFDGFGRGEGEINENKWTGIFEWVEERKNNAVIIFLNDSDVQNLNFCVFQFLL